MVMASKTKSSLLAWLCAMVVVLGLAENRAWGFFAQPQPAPGVLATSSPASTGENYDASQYDAPDCAVAPIRGAGDDLVTVYRGTDIGSELAIFDEAGAILSDAGRSAYLSARGAGASVDDALAAAYRSSGGAHSQQLSAWGSLDDYVQAHGAFGQEISVFGPRSMISFTTDPDVARRFGSTIFEFQVPRSSLIPQTLPGAGEAEVLLLHGLRK